MSGRPTWNEYFMVLALMASTRSTCLSRPTGAVIVKDKQILSTGYNGSMPGVTHCLDEGQCFRRSLNIPEEEKYNYCRSSHAEANAIARAAKKGVPIEDSHIYVTLFPCYTCAKLLAVSGIKKIYYLKKYESKNKERDKFWEDAVKEAGIESEQINLSAETIELIESTIESGSERRLKSE